MFVAHVPDCGIVSMSLNMGDLVLRDADESDFGFLLACRNDIQTIAASRTSKAVDMESHQRWLTAVLADSSRKLFVAEMDSQAVGTVRLDFTSDDCEVSWTVAADFRGNGFGRKMVCLAVTMVNVPMVAVIRATNVASQRIAAAAGFEIVESADGWTRFARPAGERSDG